MSHSLREADGPAAATPRSPAALRVIRRWARLLLALLALSIALSYFGSVHRSLDLLSNLQVQFMWSAMGLAIALALARDARWAAIAGACAIMPAMHVLPWHLSPRGAGAAHAAADAIPLSPESMRVMLFNVWQPSERYAEVIAHVREVDPDVLVLQEVDERWMAHLAPLRDDYAHVFHSAGASLRGMAIFSRLPLREVREEPLNNHLSPSIACAIEFDGRMVRALATHPWPPISPETTASRNEQLRQAAIHTARLPGPKMLIGDLNTAMWSPHYRALERLSGLRNTRRGFGVLATHPMDGSLWPRTPIDHVLVSDEFIVRDMRRGRPCGSDHVPVIVELSLPRM